MLSRVRDYIRQTLPQGSDLLSIHRTCFQSNLATSLILGQCVVATSHHCAHKFGRERVAISESTLIRANSISERVTSGFLTLVRYISLRCD